MRTKLLFICIFSFSFPFVFCQEKPVQKQGVLRNYQPNFMLGFDVLNAGVRLFSERKLYQAYVSTELKPRLHAIVDAGFEKNVFQKNGYDAKANGTFLKLGALYMLISDPENRFNGFYVGGKLAGSLYEQEYFAIPIKGFQSGDFSVSYPSTTQSSFWAEALLGARIQLFQSSFYIDANVQPKYLIHSTKQDRIQPMIVPGFGKSTSAFGVGFSWALAYKF